MNTTIPGKRLPASRLVAHRGYPGHFPENSLAGMRAALLAGARHVEFDLQFSRDGIPIVMHDENLARTTGRSGLVHDMPAELLLELNAGEPDRFGELFADVSIPTLHCMMQLIQEFPGVTAFMDIKREGLSRLRCRHALAAMLNAFPEGAGHRQAVFLSEEERIVRLAREARLRTGWLFEPWELRQHAAARQLAPDYLFTSARYLPESGNAFWKGPWQWVLYEVDTPEQAAQLIERGADLVETDWLGEWIGVSPPVSVTGTDN